MSSEVPAVQLGPTEWSKRVERMTALHQPAWSSWLQRQNTDMYDLQTDYKMDGAGNKTEENTKQSSDNHADGAVESGVREMTAANTMHEVTQTAKGAIGSSSSGRKNRVMGIGVLSGSLTSRSPIRRLLSSPQQLDDVPTKEESTNRIKSKKKNASTTGPYYLRSLSGVGKKSEQFSAIDEDVGASVIVIDDSPSGKTIGGGSRIGGNTLVRSRPQSASAACAADLKRNAASFIGGGKVLENDHRPRSALSDRLEKDKERSYVSPSSALAHQAMRKSLTAGRTRKTDLLADTERRRLADISHIYLIGEEEENEEGIDVQPVASRGVLLPIPTLVDTSDTCDDNNNPTDSGLTIGGGVAEEEEKRPSSSSAVLFPTARAFERAQAAAAVSIVRDPYLRAGAGVEEKEAKGSSQHLSGDGNGDHSKGKQEEADSLLLMQRDLLIGDILLSTARSFGLAGRILREGDEDYFTTQRGMSGAGSIVSSASREGVLGSVAAVNRTKRTGSGVYRLGDGYGLTDNTYGSSVLAAAAEAVGKGRLKKIEEQKAASVKRGAATDVLYVDVGEADGSTLATKEVEKSVEKEGGTSASYALSAVAILEATALIFEDHPTFGPLFSALYTAISRGLMSGALPMVASGKASFIKKRQAAKSHTTCSSRGLDTSLSVTKGGGEVFLDKDAVKSWVLRRRNSYSSEAKTFAAIARTLHTQTALGGVEASAQALIQQRRTRRSLKQHFTAWRRAAMRIVRARRFAERQYRVAHKSLSLRRHFCAWRLATAEGRYRQLYGDQTESRFNLQIESKAKTELVGEMQRATQRINQLESERKTVLAELSAARATLADLSSPMVFDFRRPIRDQKGSIIEGGQLHFLHKDKYSIIANNSNNSVANNEALWMADFGSIVPPAGVTIPGREMQLSHYVIRVLPKSGGGGVALGTSSDRAAGDEWIPWANAAVLKYCRLASGGVMATTSTDHAHGGRSSSLSEPAVITLHKQYQAHRQADHKRRVEAAEEFRLSRRERNVCLLAPEHTPPYFIDSSSELLAVKERENSSETPIKRNNSHSSSSSLSKSTTGAHAADVYSSPSASAALRDVSLLCRVTQYAALMPPFARDAFNKSLEKQTVAAAGRVGSGVPRSSSGASRLLPPSLKTSAPTTAALLYNLYKALSLVGVVGDISYDEFTGKSFQVPEIPSSIQGQSPPQPPIAEINKNTVGGGGDMVNNRSREAHQKLPPREAPLSVSVAGSSLGSEVAPLFNSVTEVHDLVLSRLLALDGMSKCADALGRLRLRIARQRETVLLASNAAGESPPPSHVTVGYSAGSQRVSRRRVGAKTPNAENTPRGELTGLGPSGTALYKTARTLQDVCGFNFANAAEDTISSGGQQLEGVGSNNIDVENAYLLLWVKHVLLSGCAQSPSLTEEGTAPFTSSSYLNPERLLSITNFGDGFGDGLELIAIIVQSMRPLDSRGNALSLIQEICEQQRGPNSNFVDEGSAAAAEGDRGAQSVFSKTGANIVTSLSSFSSSSSSGVTGVAQQPTSTWPPSLRIAPSELPFYLSAQLLCEIAVEELHCHVPPYVRQRLHLCTPESRRLFIACLYNRAAVVAASIGASSLPINVNTMQGNRSAAALPTSTSAYVGFSFYESQSVHFTALTTASGLFTGMVDRSVGGVVGALEGDGFKANSSDAPDAVAADGQEDDPRPISGGSTSRPSTSGSKAGGRVGRPLRSYTSDLSSVFSPTSASEGGGGSSAVSTPHPLSVRALLHRLMALGGGSILLNASAPSSCTIGCAASARLYSSILLTLTTGGGAGSSSAGGGVGRLKGLGLSQQQLLQNQVTLLAALPNVFGRRSISSTVLNPFSTASTSVGGVATKKSSAVVSFSPASVVSPMSAAASPLSSNASPLASPAGGNGGGGAAVGRGSSALAASASASSSLKAFYLPMDFSKHATSRIAPFLADSNEVSGALKGLLEPLSGSFFSLFCGVAHRIMPPLTFASALRTASSAGGGSSGVPLPSSSSSSTNPFEHYWSHPHGFGLSWDVHCFVALDQCLFPQYYNHNESDRQPKTDDSGSSLLHSHSLPTTRTPSRDLPNYSPVRILREIQLMRAFRDCCARAGAGAVAAKDAHRLTVRICEEVFRDHVLSGGGVAPSEETANKSPPPAGARGGGGGTHSVTRIGSSVLKRKESSMSAVFSSTSDRGGGGNKNSKTALVQRAVKAGLGSMLSPDLLLSSSSKTTTIRGGRSVNSKRDENGPAGNTRRKSLQRTNSTASIRSRGGDSDALVASKSKKRKVSKKAVDMRVREKEENVQVSDESDAASSDCIDTTGVEDGIYYSFDGAVSSGGEADGSGEGAYGTAEAGLKREASTLSSTSSSSSLTAFSSRRQHNGNDGTSSPPVPPTVLLLLHQSLSDTCEKLRLPFSRWPELAVRYAIYTCEHTMASCGVPLGSRCFADAYHHYMAALTKHSAASFPLSREREGTTESSYSTTAVRGVALLSTSIQQPHHAREEEGDAEAFASTPAPTAGPVGESSFSVSRQRRPPASGSALPPLSNPQELEAWRRGNFGIVETRVALMASHLAETIAAGDSGLWVPYVAQSLASAPLGRAALEDALRVGGGSSQAGYRGFDTSNPSEKDAGAIATPSQDVQAGSTPDLSNTGIASYHPHHASASALTSSFIPLPLIDVALAWDDHFATTVPASGVPVTAIFTNYSGGPSRAGRADDNINSSSFRPTSRSSFSSERPADLAANSSTHPFPSSPREFSPSEGGGGSFKERCTESTAAAVVPTFTVVAASAIDTMARGPSAAAVFARYSSWFTDRWQQIENRVMTPYTFAVMCIELGLCYEGSFQEVERNAQTAVNRSFPMTCAYYSSNLKQKETAITAGGAEPRSFSSRPVSAVTASRRRQTVAAVSLQYQSLPQGGTSGGGGAAARRLSVALNEAAALVGTARVPDLVGVGGDCNLFAFARSRQLLSPVPLRILLQTFFTVAACNHCAAMTQPWLMGPSSSLAASSPRDASSPSAAASKKGASVSANVEATEPLIIVSSQGAGFQPSPSSSSQPIPLPSSQRGTIGGGRLSNVSQISGGKAAANLSVFPTKGGGKGGGRKEGASGGGPQFHLTTVTSAYTEHRTATFVEEALAAYNGDCCAGERLGNSANNNSSAWGSPADENCSCVSSSPLCTLRHSGYRQLLVFLANVLIPTPWAPLPQRLDTLIKHMEERMQDLAFHTPAK